MPAVRKLRGDIRDIPTVVQEYSPKGPVRRSRGNDENASKGYTESNVIERPTKKEVRKKRRNRKDSPESGVRFGNNTTRDGPSAVQQHFIGKLFEQSHLNTELRSLFEKQVFSLIFDLQLQQKRKALEGRKLRDYRPREGFLNWLTSPDGALDWFNAGLITMPFLYHNAPRAYVALQNHRAKEGLPEGIIIPTRTEALTNAN